MTTARLSKSVAHGLEDCGLRLVLAESCTAGLVAATLGKIPGISQYFCGSAVTYRNATKTAWLGVGEEVLDHPGPVSQIVAEQMATGALTATPEADLAGAITGHLGPDAPTEVDGVVFVGVARRGPFGQPPAATVQRYQLQTATRAKRQQEAARLVLQRLQAAVEAEAAELETVVPLEQWKALLKHQLHATCVGESPEQSRDSDDAAHSSGLIFPGAFHPLHQGHRDMARFAARAAGRPVEFELSIENVDKSPLARHDAVRRIAQFETEGPIWLTHAATFVEKSRLFPGATFIVGIDTIARIGGSRYYKDETVRRQALQELTENDCRFLVFGRSIDGRFMTLSDLSLPDELLRLCREISQDEFRRDVSSTDIRQSQH